MMGPGMVVLWHIPVSHYSEKGRWALEHKGVAHERRAPLPGPHAAVALWLTRGRATTFPIVEFDDGVRIAGSSEIIAELERRHPEPPLIPADPQARRRALELERFFDEEAGPYVRRLAFTQMRGDAGSMQSFTAGMLPGRLARAPLVSGVSAAAGSTFTRFRYGAAGDTTESQTKVLAAFDRLEAELTGDHLVGDALTVADVAAASLLHPIVRPPEGPVPPEMPPVFHAFRDSLRDRPGFTWVERTFARYRAGARRP
jgi:glutathione S-transferase